MDSGEFRFLFSEESRISYRLTIGKSRKAFQTNIYTNDTAKWLLSLGMLLGRLELLTILVLFTPRFWRS